MRLFFSLVLVGLYPLVLSFTADIFAEYSLPVSETVLNKYGYFPPKWKETMKMTVKEMFYFGYDNYMQHAWPKDELNPVDCSGRGPDWDNPSNININDVLGNYSLTLVDSLDALLVFGNISEFHRGVRLVSDTLFFDQDVTVQVFESTIRVLGGLLSAHLLVTENSVFPNAKMDGYNNELLDLAVDLTDRLSDAFHGTESGLPHPRINLRYGVQRKMEKLHETCLAGAGSLILEFGLISRLTQNPAYERLAKGAVQSLWTRRAKATGLFGNTIDIYTGQWLDRTSGVGAGMDSFYEYLLKAYIIFGDEEYLQLWTEIYAKIKIYNRMGGSSCGANDSSHPLYVNVDMLTGTHANFWVDSLGAAFPAVQVLAGDLGEGICLHNFYANLWMLYDGLPERFDWYNEKVLIATYPLRPELAESTYFLYRATKNPFYLHVGKKIVESLNTFTRVRCGFATVHSLLDKSLEDRMESFFLSETLKYLYLLFDEENPVNKYSERIVFTTEGHIIPLLPQYQKKQSYQQSDISTVERCMDVRHVKTSNVCFATNPLLQYAVPIEEIAWKTETSSLPQMCS